MSVWMQIIFLTVWGWICALIIQNKWCGRNGIQHRRTLLVLKSFESSANRFQNQSDYPGLRMSFIGNPIAAL